MAIVLKGDACEGFLGEGNLEDFCFKKCTVVGYLWGSIFSIYTFYCIIYSKTSLIPTERVGI